MLEAFAKVFVQATQPRTAHTAVDAMECSGLSGVDELAAGLGHWRSLRARALRENRIGRNLGSDLSEGRVSLRALRAYPVAAVISCGNATQPARSTSLVRVFR